MGISRGLTRKDGPFSWLVAVAMSVCLFIEGGLIFTGGIFLVVFLNVFNEDRGKTALISSMNHGTLCFISPVGSMIANRWGKRTAVILGGAITALGLLLSSFGYNVLHLIFTHGIITGGGLGIMNVGSIGVLPDFFERWKGTALGIAVAGVGLGNFVYAYLIDILIEAYGWRGAYIILSGLSLHICLAGSLLWPTDKISNKIKSNGKHSQDKAQKPLSSLKIFCRLLQSLSFVILCCSTFLACFGFSVMVNHLPAYSLKELGLNSFQKASLSSCTGMSFCCTCLIQGVILDLPCVNAEVVMLVLMFLLGISAGCVPFVISYSGMLALSALCGIGWTVNGTTLAAVTLLYTGRELFVSAYGWVNLAGGLGMILGAPVAGWMFDAFKTYPPSFYLGGASCILGAALMLIATLLRKKGMVASYMEVSQENRADTETLQSEYLLETTA